MFTLEDMLSVLTDEQKQQLAARLTPPPTTTPPAPAGYYDMSSAVPVTFKAKLSALPKGSQEYSATFDHIWCKGHYQVRGPKGGDYFVGRCVMGVRKGQQVKGILRIKTSRFLELRAGQPIDAWFRPDGAKDSLLIGQLSSYTDV